VSVLIDTPVWSAAFRHRPGGPDAFAAELRELIREGRARLIGPVRQEVLAGIRQREDFERLRDRLRAFPDVALERGDFERAAELFSRCRAAGVQGAHADFLICAAAERHRLPILTTDGDFTHFAKHVPIRLHRPRAAMH
jgi:predicted nucleic acid-binding protein